MCGPGSVVLAAEATEERAGPAAWVAVATVAGPEPPSAALGEVLTREAGDAATRTSALRQTAGMSTVRVWQIVTVACFASISMARGRPTTMLRPTIVTFLPLSSTL